MFSIRICKLIIPYLFYCPHKNVLLANPLVLIKLLCISHMQDGYKEREDRIAELEEFINDQVTELDKIEAAMKQTVANKEIAEKELNVCNVTFQRLLLHLYASI